MIDADQAFPRNRGEPPPRVEGLSHDGPYASCHCADRLQDGPDQNAGYTNSENREWATEHAKMVCRREEVQMFDKAKADGADPQPLNLQNCQRSAMMLGPQWDADHRSSSYRFWRVACPVPI